MHDEYCNCEDCWWSRDCKKICSLCGCDEDSCPCYTGLTEKIEEIYSGTMED